MGEEVGGMMRMRSVGGWRRQGGGAGLETLTLLEAL
jgi:hypothetical protein